jgi:hypothetical protein
MIRLHFFRALCRFMGAEDHTQVDPPVAEDILLAVNSAWTEFYKEAPAEFKRRSTAALLRAPVNLAVTVEQGVNEINGTLPTWAVGCSLLIPGEPALCRVASLTPTGAFLEAPIVGADRNASAMLWNDCVALEGAEAVQGLPTINGRLPGLSLVDAFSRVAEVNEEKKPPPPTLFWAGFDAEGLLRVWLAPRPATNCLLNVAWLARPPVWEAEDLLDAEATVGLPANMAQSVFLPMVRQHLTISRFFPEGQNAVVADSYAAALRTLKSQRAATAPRGSRQAPILGPPTKGALC